MTSCFSVISSYFSSHFIFCFSHFYIAVTSIASYAIASLRPNPNTHLGEISFRMILLMISCFSFILFSTSFRKTVIAITSFNVSPVKETLSLKVGNVNDDGEEVSLLDLPELALECILERLSPTGLFTMAGVCSSLREKCTSDHLWEKHMKQKWGNLIGGAAYREWQWHIASRKRLTLSKGTKRKALFGNVSSLWPLTRNKSKSEVISERRSFVPVDSIMARYMALESGSFWFPAQVYNRQVQNGNIGFMLSCYDAELCYDSSTDTFTASYSPHGRRIIEDGIEWDRLRAPAVDTPALVAHVSDCLDDLKPGDHIEIQWRRNKDFPYGWWYGVVGHLESCSGNKNHCQCHISDTVILEFKQYTAGSRWSQTAINRKNHGEIGNGEDGFYGGIRKLYHEEEISVWKRHWPIKVVE